MSEIPPELQKLWAMRDRTPPAARSRAEDTVLMTFKDGEDPDEILRSDPVVHNPSSEPEKVLDTTEPIRDVKLFPTYKIGPQPVNLATFNVKRKRE